MRYVLLFIIPTVLLFDAAGPSLITFLVCAWWAFVCATRAITRP